MLNQQTPQTESERRFAARSQIAQPVQLHLTSGQRSAVFCDLSTTGAQIKIDVLPLEGATALLKWDGREVFGRVIWARDGRCGIAFDRPLPAHAVEHMVDHAEQPTGPMAVVDNIPFGQRRSSR